MNIKEAFKKAFDGNEEKAELAVNSYNTLKMRLQQYVASSKVYISEDMLLTIEIERVGYSSHAHWACRVFQEEKKFYVHFEPSEVSFKGLCRINEALTHISKFVQDLNVVSRIKV